MAGNTIAGLHRDVHHEVHFADRAIARLRVAERILGLREELLTLEGLLSICSYCRRLKDAAGAWVPLERYVATSSSAQLTHGICPDCYERYVKPIMGTDTT